MIKTTIDYTEEVLMDFFKFQLIVKDKVSIIYFSTSFVSLIVGILLIVFNHLYIGIGVCLVSIIMALLFPFQFKKTLKKQVSSIYKRKPQVLLFDSSIIEHFIDTDKVIKYKWENVTVVNETVKYIYLYFSKTASLIVSKDKLKKDELESLKKMIDDNKINYKYYNYHK